MGLAVSQNNKPREKLLSLADPRKLKTEDLMAILLGHGIKGLNVFDLSKYIVEFLRKNKTLPKIEDFLNIKGVGKAKALQIVSALELGRRFYQKETDTKIQKQSKDDWDFSDVPLKVRQGGVHFFHHYTAKFIPQIPEKFIRKYSKGGDIIVDPFMGCGTTLVVAKLLGNHSYGVDTNPLAIKITNAKTMVVNEKIVNEIDDFLRWVSARKENGNKTTFISKNEERDTFLFDGSKDWFRNDVAAKIRNILNRAKSYSENVKNFIEIGVSDLLKGMSNARMDTNIPTLPPKPIYIDKKHYYREINNNTREISVYSRVLSQILRMKWAILEFNKETDRHLICQPILGDSRELSKHIKSCQLVITSPPYWSAQNYQRLHLLSFKLFRLEIDDDDEIGRNGHDKYQKDMAKVQEEIAKILTGYYGLVIGEDTRDQEHLKVVESAKKIGFKLVDAFIRRLSNQTAFSKQIKNEFIYVFKI
jgi:DNA modification methylase